MTQIKKASFFMLSAVFMISCHKKTRHTNPTPTPSSGCTTTANIQYNTCSAQTGCTLTFSCPVTNQAQQTGLFEKFKSNFHPILSASASLNISSITVNSPALLASSGEVASTNWYNSPIDCTTDGNNVTTCPNFLPISSDFTIKGTLNGDVTVHVTVANDVIPVSDCGMVICGESGTTVQRMFDCSQRVTNYAGYGDGVIVHTFVPGDPNPNWFLVSSPSASDNQKCFWLSPVIEAGNPSLGDGTTQFDSFHEPMNVSPYLNGRLLWSGISANTYTFYEANNNGGSQSYYDQYTSGGGTIAVFTGLSHVLNNTICQRTGLDPARLSGSAYNWQMPSYPMIYTLTNHCANDFICNPDGFFATDAIPGFGNTTIADLFWSSSALDISSVGFSAVPMATSTTSSLVSRLGCVA